jgi:hypothetical protein
MLREYFSAEMIAVVAINLQFGARRPQKSNRKIVRGASAMFAKQIVAAVFGACTVIPHAHCETTIPYYDPAEFCMAEAQERVNKVKQFMTLKDVFESCVMSVGFDHELIKGLWGNASEARRAHCIKSATSLATFDGKFSPWTFYDDLLGCMEMTDSATDENAGAGSKTDRP